MRSPASMSEIYRIGRTEPETPTNVSSPYPDAVHAKCSNMYYSVRMSSDNKVVIAAGTSMAEPALTIIPAIKNHFHVAYSIRKNGHVERFQEAFTWNEMAEAFAILHLREQKKARYVGKYWREGRFLKIGSGPLDENPDVGLSIELDIDIKQKVSDLMHRTDNKEDQDYWF